MESGRRSRQRPLVVSDEDVVELRRLLLALQQSVMELDIRVKQEINAGILIHRLLVTLGDATEHDHDTLLMTDDRERGVLRTLVHREMEEQPVRAYFAERRVQRRQWHETLWGRLVIIGGLVTVALDVYHAIAGH